MANIPQVVDSTGTVLNQYTLTHQDNTTEIVKLTFDPSADYVAGTPFSASTMNPIINRLNITISTLTAGNTTITLTDARITANSVLSFYTSIYGVNPETVTVSNGSVELTFEAQASDMIVGVKVEGEF